jgi:hypothetical protein
MEQQIQNTLESMDNTKEFQHYDEFSHQNEEKEKKSDFELLCEEVTKQVITEENKQNRLEEKEKELVFYKESLQKEKCEYEQLNSSLKNFERLLKTKELDLAGMEFSLNKKEEEIQKRKHKLKKKSKHLKKEKIFLQEVREKQKKLAEILQKKEEESKKYRYTPISFPIPIFTSVKTSQKEIEIEEVKNQEEEEQEQEERIEIRKRKVEKNNDNENNTRILKTIECIKSKFCPLEEFSKVHKDGCFKIDRYWTTPVLIIENGGLKKIQSFLRTQTRSKKNSIMNYIEQNVDNEIFKIISSI